MAGEEIQTVRAMLAAFRAGDPPELPELRARYDSIGSSFPLSPGTTVETMSLGGVPSEKLSMPASRPDRAVLYLHGGGYAIGSSASHRSLAAAIGEAAQATVFVANYRLAPEHPFPAAVDDGVAAYRALLGSGLSAGNIVIAGDSAGGGLAVATMLAAREQGLTLPAGAALLSAWVDLAEVGPAMDEVSERDPVLQKQGLLDMAAAYLGDRSRAAPLASPIHGDLAGLPPLLIQVGTDEILLDDSRRLDRRAREQGVVTHYEEWDEMFHVWHFFHPMLREGRDAIARIGDFVRSVAG
ncbi:MAG TPA: alpha/beta hydrolase [Aliidongia sp.]|nr:alpha/beta hydrolase [Aliidongia sp.]